MKLIAFQGKMGKLPKRPLGPFRIVCFRLLQFHKVADTPCDIGTLWEIWEKVGIPNNLHVAAQKKRLRINLAT